VRRVVRAGGMTISLQDSRREFYILYTMTSNYTEWERGWFYLRNDEPGLPLFTGKVLKEKADSRWHDLSPSSRQDRLESALLPSSRQADAGLGAASVLANLHHWRIVPLMERELRIYEMSEAANPVSLEHSRFHSECFPREYAATRARRAVSLKAVKHSDDDLWSFIMPPDDPGEWVLPFFLYPFMTRRRGPNISLSLAEGNRERRAVPPAYPSSPSARAAQLQQQELAACKKERRIRRRERREQRDIEFWLCEQQGLSPLATSEYSLSGEEKEEESDGGQALTERWEPAPPPQEPRRRRRSKHLGRARECPQPGGLRKRRRVPRRCRRVPRRRLGARRWRRRPRPQRPSSPRGRGSGASLP
jgi:hypothetical protein